MACSSVHVVALNTLSLSTESKEFSHKKVRWMRHSTPDICFQMPRSSDEVYDPAFVGAVGGNDQQPNVEIGGCGIPLFLGADILNLCQQPSKYHYRIHNRFAKKGLATKVTLSGIRLLGINNSSQVWFYSVQGVFEVVFEFGSRVLQREFITKLQHVWMESYDDSLLDESITISKVHSETNNMQCDSSSSTMRSVLDNVYHIVATTRDTVSSEDNVLLAQLQQLIDVYKRNLPGLRRFPKNPSFSIFSTFASCLCDDEVLGRHGNNLGLPKEQHLFICIVCQWLGQIFYSLQETVDQSVESFKSKHIRSLDNLPPPQNIVNEVFPKFMGILIYSWMTGKTCGSSDAPLVDHTYTTRLSEENTAADSRNIWQFVQLILEFTNNTLLSGVAHVVYSRLIHGT